MAMTPDLEAAYNAQITREYAAAYSYLGMSAWFEAEGLPGMAQWMRAQSGEELSHALKFYQFVLDRGGEVHWGAIPAPVLDFATPLDVFRRSLAQEQEVTAAINEIYAIALEVKDFASNSILDWFVEEQVEEEASVQQIIDDLERAGDSGHTILMIDRELGTRAASATGTAAP